MPENNHFRHQSYPTVPVIAPCLKTLVHSSGDQGEFHSLHETLRVGHVLLVHGTFMGHDPFGISDTLKAIGRSIPLVNMQIENIARVVQERTRMLTLSVAGDIANYTPAYQDQFQKLVGPGCRVELLHPTWSSQNNHLARAELAVRILHQLLAEPLPPGQRHLLWGHSHAGNAFALLTNLLANHSPSVERFFAAVGDQPGTHWQEVKAMLQESPSPHPLAQSLLIACFATPVRYGWDVAGYAGLVHVTFHRPYDSQRGYLARPIFPPCSLNDMLNATWGDWVQAFAIAGTDIMAPVSVVANQGLTSFLELTLVEPEVSFDTKFIVPKQIRTLCGRLKTGTRCHADGLNLLIDYIPIGSLNAYGRPLETSIMGHGVTTTLTWLPAHLRLVIEAISQPLRQITYGDSLDV